MKFNEGDLVRQITEDGTGEIKSVHLATDNTINLKNSIGELEWYDSCDYELVTSNQKVMEPKFPQPQPQHQVAIVSFEGSIQREVKAIREALKVTDLSTFRVKIEAKGPLNSGEIKITYEISESEYGGNTVYGDNIREALSEMLRRHGWNSANAPTAISYDGIPT